MKDEQNSEFERNQICLSDEGDNQSGCECDEDFDIESVDADFQVPNITKVKARCQSAKQAEKKELPPQTLEKETVPNEAEDG